MLIGYARVSTRDQTPQAQLDALHAAGCERVFTETASGAKADRPELATALDYLRDGDTLVVWKLDRLARSVRQLVQTAHDLDARNIALRSLTEAIDTASPGGKLIFHVFASIAEFERALIQERTSVGLNAARRQGRTGGRPRALDADKIAVARALLASGMPVTKVAQQLGVSRSVLYRAGAAGQRTGYEART